MPIIGIKPTIDAIKETTIFRALRRICGICDENNEIISNKYDDTNNAAESASRAAERAATSASSSSNSATNAAESAKKAETDAAKVNQFDDRISTLERDQNNIKAEYLDKFNLTETQLVRSKTDWEKSPTIPTLRSNEYVLDDGKRALNAKSAGEHPDLVHIGGEQTITGIKNLKMLNGREYDDAPLGQYDIYVTAGRTIPQSYYSGKSDVELYNKTMVLSIGAISNSTLKNPVLNVYGEFFEEYSMTGCTNMTKLVCRGYFTRMHYRSCANIPTLRTVDIDRLGWLWSGVFNGSGVEAFIVRRPRADGQIPSMRGLAFDETPIAQGTGYIYVPDTLVEEYKKATNWDVYANQIKKLSELPPELQEP